MSDTKLYQSVLSKLGQLPPKELAVLDAYLGLLLQRASKEPTNIAQLAGAWSDWKDEEFEDFLQINRQTRQELFSDRDLLL
ncbi:MAG: hypothetical protein HUU01_19335 [Saprospiraceae bacterium]|nr:hypothetical protein [Saprospiraceae bacterium]